MTQEMKSYEVLGFKYKGSLYLCIIQKEYISFNFFSRISLNRALFLQYSN